jgi:hypothetical protein
VLSFGGPTVRFDEDKDSLARAFVLPSGLGDFVTPARHGSAGALPSRWVRNLVNRSVCG